MLHQVREQAEVEEVSRSAGVVTMGINPTKAHLHLGHYLTMLQAGKALHANPKALGVFFVDDREHHNKLLNADNDATFRLPREETTRRVQSLMTGFMARISDALSDNTLQRRTLIQPMSEYMRNSSRAGSRAESNGAKLYSLLWEHRNEINRLFEFEGTSSMQYVRPFCPDCRTGTWPDHEVTADADGILSRCLSESCDTEVINAAPVAGDANWSMHYTVDPIRDRLLSDQFLHGKVLHVFGGDYGIPWGRSGQAKAGRMSKLMSQVASDRIEHFVGPMLVRDGQKLAKSNGDEHAMPNINHLKDLLDQGTPIIEIKA